MRRVCINLYEEAYQLLRAVADHEHKTYGAVIEELILDCLRSSSRESVFGVSKKEDSKLDLGALKEKLDRFADFYADYLVLRKIRDFDYCRSQMPDDLVVCTIIENAMKRILKRLGFALAQNMISAHDIIAYAEGW